MYIYIYLLCHHSISINKTADLEHFQMFLGRGLTESLHLPEKFLLFTIGTWIGWRFSGPLWNLVVAKHLQGSLKKAVVI